jgi:hypothetical protein
MKANGGRGDIAPRTPNPINREVSCHNQAPAALVPSIDPGGCMGIRGSLGYGGEEETSCG